MARSKSRVRMVVRIRDRDFGITVKDNLDGTCTAFFSGCWYDKDMPKATARKMTEAVRMLKTLQETRLDNDE